MKIKAVMLSLMAAALLGACAAPSPTPAPTEAAMTVTEAVNEAATEAAPAATEAPSEAPATSNPVTFTIAADQSEARFVIGEILAGAPNTVIGVTQAVEGGFSVDYANTTGVSFQTVRVDMLNFVTDNGFRNGAIRDRILETSNPDFRYAEFTVTSVSGLPGSVEAGVEYPVEVTGALALHGVTNEVTFSGTITPVSPTQVTGLLSVTLAYADFGVQILRLPQQVASVEDLVTLELEFVANAN